MHTMNRWLRILKHRAFDETDTRRAIGPAVAARLQQRVRDSERKHSGEIRVCVEAGLPLSYLWRDADARERAIAMFSKLGVWDTEENNGVLIYLLLAEHRIEIVADRGLKPHVSAEQWRTIADEMSVAFRDGAMETGLARAIDAVDALLRRHFPAIEGAADVNELPDAPTLQ